MKRFIMTFLAVSTILGFILCFMIVSSSFVLAQETPKRGGWLKVATDGAPVGLDPHLSVSFTTLCFIETCYDTLVRYNAKMELEPSLATSWEQPDQLTYIFHLRKGVKFHDGGDFTAEDVKFNLERLLDPQTKAPQGSFFKSIAKIETPDAYTVKITMSAPNPQFMSVIGTPWYLAILSKTALQKYGTLQQNVVGTGPFKMKQYDPGVKGVYERFDNYWEKGLPYIDGYDFIIIKDDTSRMAALRNETVDIGWVKPAELANLLSKEKHLRIETGPPVRQLCFQFTHDRFPGNNIKVRQAIASAIDRQEIIDTVLMGQGTLTAAIPPAAAPYGLSVAESAKLPFYKQDLELSKKLLKEAGYPEGFEFTCKTSPHSPDYIPAAEIIQRQLAKVGIKMKIQQSEFGQMIKDWENSDFAAQIWAEIWYPDPEGYCYAYFHSKGSDNVYKVKDEKLDKLFDAQHAETNLQKRIAVWRDLQVYMAEYIPQILIYAMPARYEAVNKKVKNYKFLSNNSRIYLREAWIDK